MAGLPHPFLFRSFCRSPQRAVAGGRGPRPGLFRLLGVLAILACSLPVKAHEGLAVASRLTVAEALLARGETEAALHEIQRLEAALQSQGAALEEAPALTLVCRLLLGQEEEAKALLRALPIRRLEAAGLLPFLAKWLRENPEAEFLLPPLQEALGLYPDRSDLGLALVTAHLHHGNRAAAQALLKTSALPALRKGEEAKPWIGAALEAHLPALARALLTSLWTSLLTSDEAGENGDPRRGEREGDGEGGVESGGWKEEALGRAAFLEGGYAEAARTWETAFREGFRSEWFFLDWGEALFRLRRPYDAERVWTGGMREYPGSYPLARRLLDFRLSLAQVEEAPRVVARFPQGAAGGVGHRLLEARLYRKTGFAEKSRAALDSAEALYGARGRFEPGARLYAEALREERREAEDAEGRRH